ncbi:hypothetical protein AAZX31_20G137700 [Glycine max]|nr:hypothetical protein GLYMA_20G149751v4 [Glycine max]KAH1036185.1 hypothetical protein GYH30_055919 [Glycine max]
MVFTSAIGFLLLQTLSSATSDFLFPLSPLIAPLCGRVKFRGCVQRSGMWIGNMQTFSE